MSTIRMLRALSAVSAVFLMGGAALGTAYTSNVNPSGDWNDPNSWSPNGVPTVGDTVTIVSGDTIVVTGQHTITSVTVNSGGVLQIDGEADTPYAEVEFPSNASSPSLTVNAAQGLVLVDNARLKFSQSMTAGGSGTIQGQEDTTCEIGIYDNISGNVVLTIGSNMKVEGELAFVGMGSAGGHQDQLQNNGVIEANRAGQIILASSLELVDDADSPSECVFFGWFVNGSTSDLVFNLAATGLDGDFKVDAGDLIANATVATTGKLKVLNSGTTNTGSGSFTANGGNCP